MSLCWVLHFIYCNASVIMLGVIIQCHSAECHYAGSCVLFIVMLIAVVLSVIAQCHYAECH
jgi:hypothetical protein